jgi:hypothetical protein
MTWLQERGEVSLPAPSSTTSYWLPTEGTTITENQPIVGSTKLTPKTIGTYTEISRQLRLQSDVMGLLSKIMLQTIWKAVETSIFSGSGLAGQPSGLLSNTYSGVIVSDAANISTSLNLVLDHIDGGHSHNVGDVVVFAGRQAFRQAAAGTVSATSYDGSGRVMVDGFLLQLNPMLASNALICGPWSQLIGNMWSDVSIVVNPSANFQAGIVGLRAMLTLDFAPLSAPSFSAATGII